MLGQELMNVLYKGRQIPEIKGRYVDMGMSFKKGDNTTPHQKVRKANKRKAGELMELTFAAVNDKWQNARDINRSVVGAVESIRNSLRILAKQGRIECNNIPGMLQYRKKR